MICRYSLRSNKRLHLTLRPNGSIIHRVRHQDAYPLISLDDAGAATSGARERKNTSFTITPG
ncbi:hypothetical protein E2C01_076715 [Portunus trituberculatus]|uniref:Uncharacterized protein n=1 Tax=Portunus trituberculatus TaxID=210409 RepID=A0A5B7ICC3_PORTR|nr:hypothetical protein [Portunus trituberculatus]